MSGDTRTSLFHGLDFTEAGGGNVGDGDSGETLELDDDMLVFLDALDDAFNTGEIALGDLDTLTNLVDIVTSLKEHNRVILDRGDTNKVLHLGVGDSKDIVGNALCKTLGDITQGLELPLGGLQLGNPVAAVVDEDEVVDSGGKHAPLVAVARIDELVVHGEETLDAKVVKGLLDLDLATVGDTHGVPGHFRTQEGDTMLLHGALSSLVCLDTRHLSH